MIYTLWLLKDKASNGDDCQCWFHHPDIPHAFRQTQDKRFAEKSLKDIQRCNPNNEYELRTV